MDTTSISPSELILQELKPTKNMHTFNLVGFVSSSSPCCCSCSPLSSHFKVRASGRNQFDPNDQNEQNENKGRGFSIDWDKAWASFRKKGKKTLFSQFNMEKYVTRNPKRIDYPLSKEIDPFRKAEKTALGPWTSTKFTACLQGGTQSPQFHNGIKNNVRSGSSFNLFSSV
eukprot:TRINITY_DN176_c0_g1_i3.p1 TRINITY_DN176_c0_g1~~TRINITY_DN176_c0_g1_i3.p1  ORF type:complete len:171 (-),score=29.13 TRINITY_DN176_c0_g1_i3:1276-1788(-)